MNVTVVGSYRPGQSFLRPKSDFMQACASLGQKLAEWNHRLIVPHGDHNDTAEFYALRGFRSKAPFRFYRCVDHTGDPVLKAHFEAVEMSDAVILIGGLNGTYASGLGALRRRKLIIPIPVFGGSAKDLCEIPEIDHMLADPIRNLDVGTHGWIERLADSVSSVLNAYPRVLIIHGRGDSGRELRDRIAAESRKGSESRLGGVAAPLIMNLSGMGALSVPDVFDDLASQVSAAIAIVTADDIGGFARGEGRDFSARELQLMPRARENVWVEVGWFWGRLGRHRVFLWLKDEIDLPTDLKGAAWTRADKLDDAWLSIEAFMAKLRSPTEAVRLPGDGVAPFPSILPSPPLPSGGSPTRAKSPHTTRRVSQSAAVGSKIVKSPKVVATAKTNANPSSTGTPLRQADSLTHHSRPRRKAGRA